MQNEQKKSESIHSANGWNNIGMCLNFVESKGLTSNEFRVYYLLVRYSFGYGELKTKERGQRFWAEKGSMTVPTFNKAVNSLIDRGLIKVARKKGFVVGGGSNPYAYAPAFPDKETGFFLWIKNKKNQSVEKEKGNDYDW